MLKADPGQEQHDADLADEQAVAEVRHGGGVGDRNFAQRRGDAVPCRRTVR